MTNEQLDQLSINTIRTLSMDAVQQANSGHPGTPMALAPLVYTIWNRVMRFDPQDPIWPNRDRFVLSNGHASMLLWSVLHLTGTQAVNADYERLGQPSVSLDDIRRFRQLDSKAPGHPEYHWVSGVETTTGPLGQGVATSVGMAIAQKWLAHRYNRPGFDIFDYHIYAVCGDGCLMEGVASEAASLAGHLGLDNLCWVYDNNHITIEGQHAHHLHRGRGGPLPGLWLERAARGRRQRHRPHRARPRHLPPDEGPANVHHSGQPHRLRLTAQAGHRRGAWRAAGRGGNPPRQTQLRMARRREIPRARRRLRALCRRASASAARQRPAAVDRAFRRLPRQLPRACRPRSTRCSGAISRPAGIATFPYFPADPKGLAGRDASGKVLNVLAQNIPWFLGGSADLGPSNKTTLTFEGAGDFQADNPGRQEPAFRHPRARHGGDRERAVAVQAPALRRRPSLSSATMPGPPSGSRP